MVQTVHLQAFNPLYWPSHRMFLVEGFRASPESESDFLLSYQLQCFQMECVLVFTGDLIISIRYDIIYMPCTL